MELSYANIFIPHHIKFENSKYRKIYFFDDEGRGLFDDINDIYEKNIIFNKNYFRHFSISTAIKINNENEYKFLLNFECYQGNFELINLKTGESTIQNIKILASELLFDFIIGDKLKINPSMFFLELKKENHYLLGFLTQENLAEHIKKDVALIKFKFISTEEKPKIDINSFNVTNAILLQINEPLDSRISCIELKNGNIALSFLGKDNYLYVALCEKEKLDLLNWINYEYYLEEDYFFKLIFLKDQKGLMSFSDEYNYTILILDFQEDQIYLEQKHPINHLKYEATYHYSMDIMAFTETKIIIFSQKFHGRTITIVILDFFNDYKQFLYTYFYINIINQKMHVFNRYSLIFKYKDVLGLQFSNIVGQHGYVLFGYFNSTDPKKIYNLKKDGLNYRIKLNDYLNLQSNIFNYKIKGIKILK